MSKKNKTRNVDEQYGEEFSKWVQQFYINDNYMHGTETIDKGYLEGRKLEEYVDEKWKQFLTKYGY